MIRFNARFVWDLDDTLAETTVRLRGDRAKLPSLTVAPGALELLEHTRGKNFLVTAGDCVWQQQKIDHLNLNAYFECIDIVETPEQKDAAIEALVKRFQKNVIPIVVIGDRCEYEIRSANRLDCLSIRMRRKGGKYEAVEPRDIFEYPHKTVSTFHELAVYLQDVCQYL